MERRATLALYADYIERFYRSRDVDLDVVILDTTSVEWIIDSIRHILGSFIPAIHEASPDADLFSLGLDSLLVFRAVKSIRPALGLQNQLAPRHLYANPTLAKFSTALARLAAEARLANGTASDDHVNDDVAKMRRMIDKHKARLSFKLNPFDYVNPNHYRGLSFFFALREGINFEQVFANLQEGLRRTMQLTPALDGKMMIWSEHEIAYKRATSASTFLLLHRRTPLSGRGSWSIRIYLKYFRRSRSCEAPASYPPHPGTILSLKRIPSRNCPLIF